MHEKIQQIIEDLLLKSPILPTDIVDTATNILEVVSLPITEQLEDRQSSFYNLCKSLVLEDRSNVKEVSEFYKYWTEHTIPVRHNTKMRFEKEKVFDIPRRYATWKKNGKKFAIVNMLNR